MDDKQEEILGVYTGKDLQIMEQEGGSGYWVIRMSRIKNIKYVLFIRSERQSFAVKTDGIENGQAFLIGEFEDCIPQEWNQWRKLIKIKRYAILSEAESTKNAWKKITGNQRFPIAYLTKEDLKEKINIDLSRIEELDWKEFQTNPSLDNKEKNPQELIEEFKKNLSKAMNISENQVIVKIDLDF